MEDSPRDQLMRSRWTPQRMSAASQPQPCASTSSHPSGQQIPHVSVSLKVEREWNSPALSSQFTCVALHRECQSPWKPNALAMGTGLCGEEVGLGGESAAGIASAVPGRAALLLGGA